MADAKKEVETPAPPAPPAPPAKCSRCGSLRRSEPHKTAEVEHAGSADGRPFTHVAWYASTCLDCGQTRRTRACENRPQDVIAPTPETEPSLPAHDSPRGGGDAKKPTLAELERAEAGDTTTKNAKDTKKKTR